MDELQKLEKYLMEKLHPTERASFLKKLEDTPELRKKLLIEQRLYQAIKAEGRIEMKKELDQIHQAVNPTIAPARPRRRILVWTAAAASFLLLFSLLWFFSRPATPQQLFAQNYAPYNLTLVVRDSDQDPNLLTANDHYQQGHFQEAIPFFKKALAATPNPLLRMGLGISYLESGQLENAVAQFTPLYKVQDPLLKDQATWYLALLALKQNDTSQAQKYLKILADHPRVDHHQEAQKLLEKLK